MQKEIKNGLTIDIDLIVFETIRSWQQHQCGIAYYSDRADRWGEDIVKVQAKWFKVNINQPGGQTHDPARLPLYHAMSIYLLDGHGARIPIYTANQNPNPHPVFYHEGDLTLDGFIQALCHWHEVVPDLFQHIVNGTADTATKCRFFEAIIERI
jgi:hypothetical protein